MHGWEGLTVGPKEMYSPNGFKIPQFLQTVTLRGSMPQTRAMTIADVANHNGAAVKRCVSGAIRLCVSFSGYATTKLRWQKCQGLGRALNSVQCRFPPAISCTFVNSRDGTVDLPLLLSNSLTSKRFAPMYAVSPPQRVE